MHEKRKFGMHPKLLMDVIKRQAGTLAKAVMEGVMNSVDAKAKECRISLAGNLITLVDDGQGITKREYIESFFETFGAPHAAAEQKRFGTFRMGRGQMFSFGVNKWRTGPFEMRVDVNKDGLDYDLFETPADIRKGCEISIELYEKLKPSDLATLKEQVVEWCQYAPIKLYVNSELVTIDPEEEKWDHVLDEAYIKLRSTGNLVIYNLGVHTLEFPNDRFGTGGVVISRQQLKVNFARNDIQSDCPVWKKIKPQVQQYANERTEKKATLTDGQRKHIADAIRLGTDYKTWNSIRELKVITTVNGRHFSISDFVSCYRYGGKVSVCPAGDRRGDKLFQHRAAFILAQDTLDRFHVKSIEKLLELLQKVQMEPYQRDVFKELKILDFEDLAKGMDGKYDVLEEKELTADEQLWLAIIGKCRRWVKLAYRDEDEEHQRWYDRRKIILGTSKQADGWTDGETYIVVGRQFLKRQAFDLAGFHALGSLLLHEFCHDGPDTAEHEHGQEFYELFHDSIGCLGNFTMACAVYLPEILEKLGRKATRKMLQTQDTMHNVGQIAARAGEDEDSEDDIFGEGLESEV